VRDRSSKFRAALGGLVLFLAVLATVVGTTAAATDSTARSALPAGWIAVWLTAVVSITGYLAWAESVDLEEKGHHSR